MSNEVLFFIKLLVGIGFVLAAFRLGKYWLYSVVAVYIVLANILVTKQITLFGLAATGGNVVYGCTFLVTDLLAEHYGKREARRAVLVGFFASAVYLAMSQLILAFQPSGEDFAQEGMVSIFSLAPRIVAASLAAYLVSQFHDIWAFHFWRKLTKGKRLWMRNNFSTWVSQLMDTTVFVLGAFYGVFPGKVLLQIIITTYILKVIVALIDTPFIYLSYKLKPRELRGETVNESRFL